MDEIEGFCMKCRIKVAIDPIADSGFTKLEIKELKNKCLMVKGQCGVCGTTVCKILKKGQAAELKNEELKKKEVNAQDDSQEATS